MAQYILGFATARAMEPARAGELPDSCPSSSSGWRMKHRETLAICITKEWRRAGLKKAVYWYRLAALQCDAKAHLIWMCYLGGDA